MKRFVTAVMLATLVTTGAATSVDAAQKVKVTYVENGGNNVSNQTVNKNSNPKEPSISRKGYTFTGWYTDKGLTKKWNTSTGKVTKNTTLYAKWSKNKYTLAFDTNGGTSIASSKVYYNTQVVEPTTTRKGYTFDGWYMDDALTRKWNEKSGRILANLTLHAKWTVNEYDVNFHSNGGTEFESVKVQYNTNVTEPTPVKEGYRFDGWYMDEALTRKWNAPTGRVLATLNLYAKWTEEVKVTFNSNDGTAIAPITLGKGENLVEPTEPVKNGFVFDGWYTDAGLTTKWDAENGLVNADTTLFAKWAAAYTVSFSTDGGNAIAPMVVKADTNLEEPTPVKAGYTFTGWYTDATFATPWDATNGKVTANVTLYAKYDAAQYTLTYVLDNGEKVDPVKVEYNSGVDEIADPTKTGYVFDGWYTDEARTKQWNKDTSKITGDTTLYAKWSRLYKVTFDTSGGDALASATVKEGTNLDETAYVPTNTDTTKVFDAWYTDSALTTKWDATNGVVTKDTVLYAKWASKVTITFDKNGGTSTTDATKEVAKGSTPDLKAVTASRDGYRFDGWYTSAACTTKFAGAVNADVTVYAKWTKIVTVTFKSDADVELSKVTLTEGANPTEPAAPAVAGHKFLGWYTGGSDAVTSTTLWNASTSVIPKDSADFTVYAKYEVNKYTVTFDTQGSDYAAPASLEVAYDGLATKPVEDPKFTNKVFGGWYSDKACTKEWDFATNTVKANTTLYAKWN